MKHSSPPPQLKRLGRMVVGLKRLAPIPGDKAKSCQIEPLVGNQNDF